MEQCLTCKFFSFDKTKNQDYGICRRYPPTAQLITEYINDVVEMEHKCEDSYSEESKEKIIMKHPQTKISNHTRMVWSPYNGWCGEYAHKSS